MHANMYEVEKGERKIEEKAVSEYFLIVIVFLSWKV